MNSLWEFLFGDSLVLVRPDSPGLYILNTSAACAWNLLRSGKSHLQAVREFAARFEIPDDIAARDLAQAFEQWQQTVLSTVLPSVRCPAPPAFPNAQSPEAFSGDYRLNGKTIRVILHHPELIAEIAPRLEPILVPPSLAPDATLQVTATAEDTYHVFSDASCIATEDHPANARVVFLQELARRSQHDRDWAAILHAGACGTQQKCVIFPAETHSGKSTLAAALMHAGLTFYGDDSIPLEAESFTVPVMPFALMIREGSWPEVSARFPEFASAPVHHRYGQNVRFLHPVSPSHPASARPIAIVFSQWQPGASTTISSLDSFEGLIRLNASGFWVDHKQTTIQAFLDWLQSLPIYEIVYSDLTEAIAFIRETLAKH